MSERGMQEDACKDLESRKYSSLYVFPNATPCLTGQQHHLEPATEENVKLVKTLGQGVGGLEYSRTISETPILRIMSASKTHARSASHGGVLASSSCSAGSATTRIAGNSNWMGGAPVAPVARPSALKKPGHQRAFSQGQVVEVQRVSGDLVAGNSRIGSKTDFILPPGHREDAESRPTAVSKAPSFRGHSRQASRSESIYTIRRSVAPPLWRRVWSRYFGNAPEEPHLRTIVPNHLLSPHVQQNQQANGKVIDNRIRTTKYSTLTFLPRNLLEQFHRVANLYFIFIVLLNWVPAINAFGKEVAMIPVIFVLGVTALKDFFEDRRRLASDRRVNNSTCRVYVSEENRYKKITWKNVKVGDIIHLSNNELVPADMLLLRSSDSQGFAYLDTCNLDGETNLKQRQVVRGFLDLQTSFQPSKFRSIIEIDKPSTKIYRFHGAVVHPNGARIPVSTENLLLRECVLKNTDFVEGIVVYVGHETKAMLNNGGPRYKRSRLERQMNLDVIWCVVILIVLCIIGATGCRFWLSTYALVGSVPFLPIMQDPSYEGMLTFWTFIIILQVMIPLSLYVTIEMAKLGQVYHIINDRELYDVETDRTAECRALNITEELGQVQYVFSDKTGTLTENKMIFRRCAVGGQDYAHTGDGETLLPCKRLKEDLLIGNCRHRLQEFLILLAICNTVVVNTHPHHDNMNSSGVIEETNHGEPDSVRYLQLTESRSATPVSLEASSSDQIYRLASPSQDSEDILTPITSLRELNSDGATVLNYRISRPKLLNLPTISSLAILTKRLSPLGQRNSSSSVSNRNNKPMVSEISNVAAIYEAESPDELALVHAAKAYDVRLTRRTAQCATVSLPDKSCLAFEILKILPFDSNRKCMSIIVRHPYTNEIVLYSKGADSTILSALSSNEEESSMTTKVRQQLHSYSRQGLRTLVMARRSLSPEEYGCWREKHAEIEASADSNRERRVRESFASLESQMSLLGATGIEDKLQAGVPEAMASLLSAGIVVWVLTGDKPETAVNIAYSSSLFSPAMQLLRLQARSKSMAESLIHTHLEAAKRETASSGRVGEEARRARSGELEVSERIAYRIGAPWQRQRALVVDGKTLTFILDPRSGLTAPFLELTTTCASVLACRTTPLQKAYIVKVVKEQLRMRTLAIGDGANDVSMIQTADVGIGVSGREGTQAVMAADFSIPRFPMLTRLLFMHGHWCYDRLSRMILYFFYKNATFVFVIFWYQLYCGFSGAVMIDQIYLMLYNLIFTSLPPLVLGIYDQVAPAELLLEVPRLYERGRLASVYQPHSFWIIMADALYQSIVIFFLIEAAYHDSDVDIWEFGSTITTCCIIVMLLHISIETRSWTLIHAAGILASFSAFFGFSLFYNAVCVSCLGLPGSYWVMEKVIAQHIYWLSIILASVLAILPRILYRTVKSTIAPDIIQRARAANFEKSPSERLVRTEDNELVAEWSRTSEHATIRSGNYTGKKNILTTIVA